MTPQKLLNMGREKVFQPIKGLETIPREGQSLKQKIGVLLSTPIAFQNIFGEKTLESFKKVLLLQLNIGQQPVILLGLCQ